MGLKENDHSLSSINSTNVERDRQKVYPSKQTINTQKTLSVTNDLPTENDEEETENDDCFKKFGLISSSSKKPIEENHPEPLVEEIAALTSLIIYNTYSKKHVSASRTKNLISSNSIRDDINRFDQIYSCLSDQNKQSNVVNNYLRNRFFNLLDVNQLKTFQQTEQIRITKEKKMNFNRIPFIPNILSYQRRCPYYNLKEIKWIRDHLC